MNRDTYEIIDYTQYRMYLNETNKSKMGHWNISYHFKEYYNMTKFDIKSIAQIGKKYYVNL